MAVAGDRLETARCQVVGAVAKWRAELQEAAGSRLGEGLIATRELKDQLEAVFVESLARFDKAGEFARDGSVDLVAWVREKCRYTSTAAAERVGMARQIDKLPQTKQAFATGELAYQHVAVMTKAADHVGAAAVRKAESSLLRLAETMGPGEFTGVAKNFEIQVNKIAALAETNRAHQRRYLNIGEPTDGMIRIDGMLDAEAGAVVRNAVNSMPPPAKGDDRTPGQRRADRLVEICIKPGATAADGGGPRPHLIIRASVDTLAGLPGAPGGELDGGVVVSSETVQRYACDTALTRITGKGELDAEVGRASRTIPPATRRALAARDRGCVVVGCNRPPQWTDAHHLKHWAHGGPTVMSNLVLLCRHHHRRVHEDYWHLHRIDSGRWRLTAPIPRSRSA